MTRNGAQAQDRAEPGIMVVVAAGKAAPGATCTATALALSWPRPVLLLDADPAGGDVVAGLLPGRAGTQAGVLTWATRTRRGEVGQAVDEIGAHVLALPEAPHVWVMAGVGDPARAAFCAVGGCQTTRSSTA